MVSAMRYFSERNDLTIDQYIKGIQDIIGLTDPPEAESYFYAKCLFRYVVQETIRSHIKDSMTNMDDILDMSIQKTYKYIEENPWSVTLFNINHGLQETDEIDEQTGEIKAAKPKGGKKDTTERIFNELKSKGASRQAIIDAFVHETGMSKAGATTYFHALKKTLGFTESTQDKKSAKGESKQEIAERLYEQSDDKSKTTMITLFTEQLGTSKLGAQTYYYACKKKFAVLTDTP